MKNQVTDTDFLKYIIAFASIIAVVISGFVSVVVQVILKGYDSKQSEKNKRKSKKTKFYIPLLRCLYELDERISTIIDHLHTDWLSEKYLTEIKDKKGFAADPNKKGYFIISSIYLVASFFGLSETIKKDIDATKFSYEKHRIRKIWGKILARVPAAWKAKQKPSIFQFNPEITKVYRLFQQEELFKGYLSSKSLTNPRDASKIHKHIQRSIGEMMLEKEGEKGYRVKSFREFYEAYINDETFRFWFVLIENLFIDLINFPEEKSLEAKVETKRDIRPLRIITIQYWCRVLMENISQELDLTKFNFQTRQPSAIVENLSTDLKNTITKYRPNKFDSYILSSSLIEENLIN